MQQWLVRGTNPKLWLMLAAGLVLAAAGIGVGLSHAESSSTTGSPTPTPGASSANVFLKLDGVQGESTDSNHVGEIEVSSFNWPGVTNPGSGGSGAGKVTVNDFTITKHIDKSSPTLMQACAGGKHFPSATITVRKAGGTQQEYLTYTMSDVQISSVQQAGSDQPTEQLSLNFSKISVKYTPQKPDGSLDSPVEGVVSQLSQFVQPTLLRSAQ